VVLKYSNKFKIGMCFNVYNFIISSNFKTFFQCTKLGITNIIYHVNVKKFVFLKYSNKFYRHVVNVHNFVISTNFKTLLS
jgi:hypothetical protein